MIKIALNAFVASIFIFKSHADASNKMISDSLVEKLSCKTLSIGSMLGSIRPDAFSSRHHLPLKNWGFRSGAAKLGACWGMSSTQRKLFYLLRLEEPSSSPLDILATFDMIRGATLSITPNPHSPNDSMVTETALKKYQIIPLKESSLREEFARNTGLSFIEVLLKGVRYKFGGFPIQRDLKIEIERSQERHFFRPGNIRMGAGSGPQSPKTNFKTVALLKRNLRINRLTLINLRLKALVQHIVIAKSFTEDTEGNMKITVYDSNSPHSDRTLHFDFKTGHFYSAEIMGSFFYNLTKDQRRKPLGVFVVDEQERTHLEAALLKHYKSLCQL